VAELSEWLKIMLGEVARKSDERARAVAEQQARAAETRSGAPPAGAAT
jgi:hypothetical protein